MAGANRPCDRQLDLGSLWIHQPIEIRHTWAYLQVEIPCFRTLRIPELQERLVRDRAAFVEKRPKLLLQYRLPIRRKLLNVSRRDPNESIRMQPPLLAKATRKLLQLGCIRRKFFRRIM